MCLSEVYFTHAAGQDIIRKTDLKTVCYAGTRVNRIYIPPPEEFYRKEGGAKITVNYTGFNSLAKGAFQYAVSILSSILPENASFNIKAVFEPLSDPNVLAQASATYFMKGSAINAFDPLAYYSAPLAEKISGISFNDISEPDVEISVNSLVTWYSGTSGDTPSSMYDLVTVVLHELIHGLGFFDSYRVADSVGAYGFYGTPVIYDKFVVNNNYKSLTDTLIYPNPSGKLKTELTGNKVFFFGPVVNALNNGTGIKLFAPSEWNNGSSIAHFDESFTPQADALMTPYIDRGEAIHSPGKLARALLGEIGWINTGFIHKRLSDTEDTLEFVDLKTKIVSDTVFIAGSAGVAWYFGDQGVRDTIYLSPTGEEDTFAASIPVTEYNTSFSYSFFVKDCFGRIFRLPSAADPAMYRIFIGTDTVKPVINHTPPELVFSISPSVIIAANADDNIGIDTVYLEYEINDGATFAAGMQRQNDNKFMADIDLTSLGLSEGDTIKYRITAIDKSREENMKTVPESGFYKIPVEKVLMPSASYSTDFSDAQGIFINRGFEITAPSGFAGPALHTRHPYESPEKDNEKIEYISILKVPIKIDRSGLAVRYDEIVLVEPGEEGSVFGSEDFYDYVIIEGSTDFGNSWFPLTDGYDSRVSSVFLNAYNSSVSGMNSTYQGRQSMFRGKIFTAGTSGKISVGDTLMIRFRLFSDPYAHGWGWAIDNLEVKSLTTSVTPVRVNSMNVYPNPGNGMIYFTPARDDTGGIVECTVRSLSGIEIKSCIFDGGNGFSLDITDQPAGVYLISIRSGKSVAAIKYVKVN